ncbi:OmpA family protein [Taibaiella lutea]|uniref:OmpA family protein n=1 Tax=Taibaiella lutea TaxID=2608001 RepID=A0A5M6CIX2_9BACT|nr:OmpA family protein [Taibaiella lutea]KAA5533345.1 OmpA family protein [Taibaiella lutea]
MKLKLLFSGLCLGFASLQANAQNTTMQFGSPVKGPLLGFGVNLTDFSASLPDVGTVNLGASLMYWQGINKNLDFSIRYNGLFSDYAKPVPNQDNKLISELEGSLHLRALSDNHFLNPFISAGIGGGTYSGSFAAYAPVGIGLQFNIYSESYIFLQANYRFSFQDTKLDKNTFYSLGFAVPLRSKSTPASAPVTPPPPTDQDGDGTTDAMDECPTLAGPVALKGCPDKDNDGVADKYDKCPDVAGTVKYLGCPIPDNDKDGVNDEEDKCPTVAGLAKYAGCPVPDSDGDGVNDEMDKCPTVAGTAANRGCPEVKEEVKKKLAFAATAIQFETGKSSIKQQSYSMLDEIVTILNEYPDYNMTIDGYTDNTGNAAKNMELSRLRADAVKAYFVGKGISVDRITANGHGIENPVADNKTAAGRAKNRRVEMDLKLKD